MRRMMASCWKSFWPNSGDVGSRGPEQLRDDGGDAAEVARAQRPFEPIGEIAGLDVGLEARTSTSWRPSGRTRRRRTPVGRSPGRRRSGAGSCRSRSDWLNCSGLTKIVTITRSASSARPLDQREWPRWRAPIVGTTPIAMARRPLLVRPRPHRVGRGEDLASSRQASRVARSGSERGRAQVAIATVPKPSDAAVSTASMHAVSNTSAAAANRRFSCDARESAPRTMPASPDRRAAGAGGEPEHRVAVRQTVGRADRPGQPVVSGLGESAGLGSRQRRIGGDDADRRVECGSMRPSRRSCAPPPAVRRSAGAAIVAPTVTTTTAVRSTGRSASPRR